MFPNFSVRHLTHSFSGHCPLFIQTNSDGFREASRWIKFEAWWCMEDSCEEIVKSLWENLHGPLLERLQGMLLGLKE